MNKLVIVTLFALLPLTANAAIDPVTEAVSADLAVGDTIEQIITQKNEQEGLTFEYVSDLIANNADKIIAIVSVTISNKLELAAQIVQAAVEANTNLAQQIVDAAIAAGADPDEMLVAALLGGANDEDLSIETAAGGFAAGPALGSGPNNPALGNGNGGGGATASPN
ncbi:hypothetical protein [Psychromonas antarctica]|uniref:hypothetical protein n=1 Tax=Psychromonas antarctica TaxID=67573 RepID=UPI001EE8F086|nr:hypothetical protein [Psychromonas antarctica]MCG6201917.1 hypothetical protein [Psychromonas antarctica]